MGLHRHFNFCTRDTPPLSDIWKEQRVIKGCWIVQTATFSYICWMNYFDECRLLYCSWFPAHFEHLSDRQQPINHQMHLFLILVVANWINSATFSSLYLKHIVKQIQKIHINLDLFHFVLSRKAHKKSNYSTIS